MQIILHDDFDAGLVDQLTEICCTSFLFGEPDFLITTLVQSLFDYGSATAAYNHVVEIMNDMFWQFHPEGDDPDEHFCAHSCVEYNAAYSTASELISQLLHRLERQFPKLPPEQVDQYLTITDSTHRHQSWFVDGEISRQSV